MRDETRTGDRRPSGLLLSIVAGLASGAIVAAITWMFLSPRESSTSQRVEPADIGADALAELRASIEGLRAEVSRLRGKASGVPDQPEPKAAAPLTTTAPLELQLSQLAAVVERIAASTGAREWPPTSVDPDPARIAKLKPIVTDPKTPHTHLWRLWTPQQLLEEYGPPNLINPFGNGMHWDYLLDDGSNVILTIADGLAVDITVHKPP